jgi:hypothetical protein
LIVTVALIAMSGAAPKLSAQQDELIEHWHEEASRMLRGEGPQSASPAMRALPTGRGWGWRRTWRGVSYGITAEGVKWMDAPGIFTTSTPYGSKMCAVIEQSRYCF